MRSVEGWVCLFVALLLAGNAACSREGSQRDHSKLPFGSVDLPANGATVKGMLAAGGWALSEDGIDEVDLYIDRTFLSAATIGGARADVLKAYPTFMEDPNPGWNVSEDITNLAPGTHELTVQAHSKSGSVRDLGTLQINVVQ